MLRVALTGGIASGKSLVADTFARLGAPVVDADVIAREVVAPGSEGLAAVVDAFGGGVLAADGTLDRARLRRYVFRDDDARRRLEGILHPLIRRRMEERLDEHAASGAPYAIAVIPLLVETGQCGAFDRVLVVDAPTDVQIERVMERDGISEAEARSIVERQAGRHERLAHADDVITNDATIDPSSGLEQRVAALDREYRQLAAAG